MFCLMFAIIYIAGLIEKTQSEWMQLLFGGNTVSLYEPNTLPRISIAAADWTFIDCPTSASSVEDRIRAFVTSLIPSDYRDKSSKKNYNVRDVRYIHNWLNAFNDEVSPPSWESTEPSPRRFQPLPCVSIREYVGQIASFFSTIDYCVPDDEIGLQYRDYLKPKLKDVRYALNIVQNHTYEGCDEVNYCMSSRMRSAVLKYPEREWQSWLPTSSLGTTFEFNETGPSLEPGYVGT